MSENGLKTSVSFPFKIKGTTGDLENTILTRSNKHESFRFKETTGTEV